MKYNFDKVINREHTYSIKTDFFPEHIPADVLPLWVADMDFSCAEPILEALHKRIDRQIFGYTAYDNEDLKRAVTGWFSRRYGWEIKPEDIFYSPGVVPAIAFLIQALTEPGDGVIIQRPVYHPFTAVIESNGRVVANNSLIEEEGQYRMDFEDLAAKLANPANKGMILCSPHNPVGRVWTEDELRRVVELCKAHDKWIISDEIHCDLTRLDTVHHPLLTVAPDYAHRIVACTAPSKSFNLAGMQLSNIIIPNPEYQKKWLENIDSKCHVSMAGPMGITAVIAAYNEGEEWLDQVREYIDGNIAYVKAYINKHFSRAKVADCQGTYLMWVDFRAYAENAEELERKMLQEAKVYLDEGYIFGAEGAGFERINVASPRCVIEECMKRLSTIMIDE